MDEKLLRVKIEELFSTSFILENSLTNNWQIHEMVKNIFSYDELKYINMHPYLLEPYNKIEIQINLIVGKEYDFLKTDLGTYLLERRVSCLKENSIDLFSFYKVLAINSSRYTCYSSRHFDLNRYFNYDCSENHNRKRNLTKNTKYLLIDLLEIYTYYNAVKNKDIRKLKYTTDIYSINAPEYFNLPIEFFCNNDVKLVALHERVADKYNASLFEKFKYCQQNGYDFSENKRLMFLIDIYTETKSDYIKDNMNELKKFIYDEGYTTYSKDAYDYLKKFFPHELDDKFLIKIYKSKVVWINHDPDTFKEIARKIPNNSPFVKLTKDSELVHVKYNRHDIYKDDKIVLNFLMNEKDSFEQRFLRFNDLIVKLYRKWYKIYLNNNKEENIDNLYDFIHTILVTPEIFKVVINDSDITINEARALTHFVELYSLEEQQQFSLFYKNYVIEEKKKWINIFNMILKYKSSSSELDKILSNLGINKDNAYQIIISNKFLDSKCKEALFNIIGIHYGTVISVIDIINILDEMIDREMNLNDILKEKNISKKYFNKVYNDSLKNNPILYEYIKESLSENRRRGYKKLIRLGYVILNSNLTSYNDYKERFSEYDFDKLLVSLNGTELVEKLTLLAHSWEDYDNKMYKENVKKKV